MKDEELLEIVNSREGETADLVSWELGQALKRPLDYSTLSSEEQWRIDDRLGILDWDPTAAEAAEYLRLRSEQVKL